MSGVGRLLAPSPLVRHQLILLRQASRALLAGPDSMGTELRMHAGTHVASVGCEKSGAYVHTQSRLGASPLAGYATTESVVAAATDLHHLTHQRQGIAAFLGPDESESRAGSLAKKLIPHGTSLPCIRGSDTGKPPLNCPALHVKFTALGASRNVEAFRGFSITVS